MYLIPMGYIIRPFPICLLVENHFGKRGEKRREGRERDRERMNVVVNLRLRNGTKENIMCCSFAWDDLPFGSSLLS